MDSLGSGGRTSEIEGSTGPCSLCDSRGAPAFLGISWLLGRRASAFLGVQPSLPSLLCHWRGPPGHALTPLSSRKGHGRAGVRALPDVTWSRLITAPTPWFQMRPQSEVLDTRASVYPLEGDTVRSVRSAHFVLSRCWLVPTAEFNKAFTLTTSWTLSCLSNPQPPGGLALLTSPTNPKFSPPSAARQHSRCVALAVI